MRISDIDDKMDQLKSELETVNKKLMQLKQEHGQLKNLRRNLEIDYFKNWLQKDQLIEINHYKWFKGIETTKEQTYPKAPHFMGGEQLQVLKINQKSILVQSTKGLFKGRTFRIELDSFYSHLMDEESIRRTFSTWMIRSESLDLLCKKLNNL